MVSAGKQPNILFILVDEMRFPKVFPKGITTPDQFLQTFMPNTYKLWSNGVNSPITTLPPAPARRPRRPYQRFV